MFLLKRFCQKSVFSNQNEFWVKKNRKAWKKEENQQISSIHHWKIIWIISCFEKLFFFFFGKLWMFLVKRFCQKSVFSNQNEFWVEKKIEKLKKRRKSTNFIDPSLEDYLNNLLFWEALFFFFGKLWMFLVKRFCQKSVFSNQNEFWVKKKSKSLKKRRKSTNFIDPSLEDYLNNLLFWEASFFFWKTVNVLAKTFLSKKCFLQPKWVLSEKKSKSLKKEENQQISSIHHWKIIWIISCFEKLFFFFFGKLWMFLVKRFCQKSVFSNQNEFWVKKKSKNLKKEENQQISSIHHWKIIWIFSCFEKLFFFFW